MMAQEVNSNGTGLGEKTPPSLEQYKRLEQIGEVVAVVGLACSLCIIWLNVGLGWLVLPMIVVIAACAFAIHNSYQADKCSYQAEEASALARQEKMYEVTKKRLKILTEKGVQQDVIDIITGLEPRNPMKAPEVLEALETELGQERTDEVRETLLKYLRIDKKVTPNPAGKTDNTPAAQPTKGASSAK